MSKQKNTTETKKERPRTVARERTNQMDGENKGRDSRSKKIYCEVDRYKKQRKKRRNEECMRFRWSDVEIKANTHEAKKVIFREWKFVLWPL